ncbi:MAG: putative quinol monooxygenase [Rhizomicrobium sp.]|nr:putative quinol monooxygenase [Rhizomicrobium sp.]
MTDAISLVAAVQAKPGDEDAVESAIRSCVAATRHEAGCLSYIAHRDLDVAGKFVFIERWASRAALASHEKEPHFLALVAALDGKTVGSFSVSLLSALD